MSWPLVKLGTLCKVVRGSSPRPKGDPKYYGGNVPRLMVSDVTRDGKFVTPKIDFLTEAGAEKSRPMKKGDFIIAVSGQPGQALILAIDACIHDGFAGLRELDESKVNKDYLFHFMNATKERFSASATGAIFKNLTTEQIRELEIPLPPLNEQQRIAAILDKADCLSRKRQQAIGLADDFLRSVFLDMFGDPVTNSKGWEVKPLKELTLKIGSGSTPRGGKEAYLDQGISLIRSLNVHDNKFVHKDLAFISDVQADKLKNVVIEKDDLLLNITGASVCRATLVDNNILPARVNQHVCIVRAKTEKVLPTFLARLITSSSYKQKLMQIATAGGATREALTKQQVESLDIIVPPLDVQDKFLSIVYRVEKMLKSSELQSQKPLFNSLSQKAFAGEL